MIGDEKIREQQEDDTEVYDAAPKTINESNYKVTDKSYYLDLPLQNLVKLMIKRERRNWDNLIIIDGMERSGKTTLAKMIAYYYAWLTKRKFTIDNIFFDVEKLMEFATTTQQQIIVWDEAAFAGLSNQWHNKAQQKLITTLMVTGKYRHFYIFIIPSFFRLNRYMAIDRSIGLISVYSPDLVSRGYFTGYNRAQKAWIYNNNKKSETYGKSISFHGQFVLKGSHNIIDEAEYEKRKDDAIIKYTAKDSGAVSAGSLFNVNLFKSRIANRLTAQQAYDLIGIDKRMWKQWKDIKIFENLQNPTSEDRVQC